MYYMQRVLSYLPLKQVPQHFEEIVQIIEEELGYSPENSFQNDFLPLMEPHNWENCYVLFLGNEVIGHIGLKPTLFYLSDLKFPICFIGGICLKKQYQGKGYFKEIFPTLLNSQKKNFALFALWTGEAEGYKKFGFYELGKMVQTGEYDFDNSLRFFHRKLSELSVEEKNFIKQSYQHSFQQYLKPERKNHDWESIFSMTSVDVYFKKRNETILSYFMINKGQDLTQIIHEIGAVDEREFIQLYTDLNKFKMWLPDNMGHLFPNATFLFLGVFKLANTELFLKHARQLGIPLTQLNQEINEKETLEAFFNSDKINFYIPGVNSI